MASTPTPVPALAVLLGLELFFGVARAQPGPCAIPPESARKEAEKLVEQANQTALPQALGYLESAYRLHQHANTLYNLGQYWFRRGRRLQAADLLRRYAKETPPAHREAPADALERMLAVALPAHGELLVSAERCSFVYVDGHLIGRAPLSLPLLLQPGQRELRLELGRLTVATRVTVAAGQVHELELRIPGGETQLGPPEQPAQRHIAQRDPAHSAPPAGPRSRPHWRVALGAAGITAGAVLGVFGGLALSVNGECTMGDPARCPMGGRFYQTTAPGAALVSVGAALVLGGAVLWAWPPRRDRAQ